jgi:hypothetical protein
MTKTLATFASPSQDGNWLGGDPSPWEDGRVKRFNSSLGDELLNRHRFKTLLESRLLFERWCKPNTVSPHSGLGFIARRPQRRWLQRRPPRRAALQRIARAPGLSYAVTRTMRGKPRPPDGSSDLWQHIT